MQKVLFTTLLIEKSPQALPLGAACCASALKNNPRTKGRFDVKLIPFNRESEEIESCFANLQPGDTKNAGERSAAIYIARKIAEYKPDIVNFSVYVWNHVVLEYTAEEIKKLLPSVITVAGGPEVTANPRAFKNFDWTIAGQGEEATIQLLLSITNKENSSDSKDGIPGVYFNSLDKENTNNNSPVKRTVPCPAEQLHSPYLDGTIDVAEYGGALWELARGCPFKCSYCYESKGEKKIAYFPMERLEKEIELFAKKKINQVFVLDPTYNASKERAIRMLKIIEKKAPGMFFYFEARAEFIDRELARAFTRIPCALQIGLQSADVNVLKNVNRTLDRKKFERNIGYLNEEGVTFGLDLIFGLPGDTYKGFKNSIDFALSLYPNNLELFCLSVLPGTNLYDTAKSFGVEWQAIPPYHVIKTPQFPPEDLKKADTLSKAVNLFYTKGRAVPWFNNVLFPLREKASKFFEDFVQFLNSKHVSVANITDDSEIEDLQREFVHIKYREHKLEKLWPVAEDLIKINGALGKCTFDGTESTFTMNYHPDDIMSEYACDLHFFAQNAGKQKCRVKVFNGKNGPDWKTVR